MAESLKQIANCPLPVRYYKKDFSLHFFDDVKCRSSSGKPLEKMKNLFKHLDEKDGKSVCYDFYEGVAKEQDIALLKKYKLRYDMIVIHPGDVAGEFKKTSGHYHCLISSQNLSYPEIYEVLQGSALFILQQVDEAGTVSKSFAVKGKPGDKLIIPPNYGHVTVNIGSDALFFADLVSTECINSYGAIGDNHGMCYYVLKSGNKFILEKNPSYKQANDIRVTSISENPALGTWRDKALYPQFMSNPNLYDYLNNPDPFFDKFIKF